MIKQLAIEKIAALTQVDVIRHEIASVSEYQFSQLMRMVVDFFPNGVKDELDCKLLYRIADTAGRVAVTRAIARGEIIAMAVGQETSFLSGKLDWSKPVDIVNDGVCGFAWVIVKPANSRFAKWLIANGHARKDSYYGGVNVWVGDYNQSMQKKERYADAFAAVLEKAGINAYSNSRMD
jgi:hypothetical protein